MVSWISSVKVPLLVRLSVVKNPVSSLLSKSGLAGELGSVVSRVNVRLSEELDALPASSINIA